MAFQIGELVWKITGDPSGINKSLQGADKQVNKTGKGLSKLGSTLAKVGGIAAAVALGKRLIGAASDAEEVANKFGVVFSDVGRLANDMAGSLATNYGLARTEAKKLLSNTGDLLTGFGFTQIAALEMSDQVNRLAVDLASFTNIEGGSTRASAALTSALLGEREAVKSLGISITEADIKELARQLGLNDKALTRQEKAMLTLQLATRQSANAIGDFERSQESFANQVRIASAGIQDLSGDAGNLLLPIATKLVKVFNQLITGVKGWQKATETLDEKLVRLGVQLQNNKKIQEEISDLNKKEITEEQTIIRQLERSNASRQKRINLLQQQIKFARSDDERKSLEAQVQELERLSSVNQGYIEQLGSVRQQMQRVDGAVTVVEESISRTNKKSRDLNKTWDELSNAERFDLINNALGNVTGNIINSLNAVSQFQQVLFDNRIAQLDEEEKRVLEAAGVAEETQREKLETELAQAKEAGDEELIQEKERELKRATIQEEFAKKRSQLEYEGNLAAWELQKAQAIIQVALAPINAYVSSLAIPIIGPIVAPINAALAAATARLQLAAVTAARPTPPSFHDGGVFNAPTPGGEGLALLRDKEQILTPEQRQSQPNSAGSITIHIGDDLIYNNLYRATQDGNLLIDTRSVVSR